jgi:hypothetical protein
MLMPAENPVRIVTNCKSGKCRCSDRKAKNILLHRILQKKVENSAAFPELILL